MKDNFEELLDSNTEMVVMIEIPSDSYFDSLSNSIKALVEREYHGVFVCVQRPFQNVHSEFERRGIPLDNIRYVDVATVISGNVPVNNDKCLYVKEDLDMDSIISSIYKSMDILDGRRKFIFIDSLSTLALYKPLSEVWRLSEFLSHSIKTDKRNPSLLIINASKDSINKILLNSIKTKVDKVVSVNV